MKEVEPSAQGDAERGRSVGAADASRGPAGNAGEKERCVKNRELGLAGEDAACAFLKRRGYRILDRNYRCPAGEIDIIAAKHRQLVFCEVKTRTGGDFEEALEAVDTKRQSRMARAASHYLAEERHAAPSCRFDVIALLKCGSKWKIVHVEDAFEIGEL